MLSLMACVMLLLFTAIYRRFVVPTNFSYHHTVEQLADALAML